MDIKITANLDAKEVGRMLRTIRVAEGLLTSEVSDILTMTRNGVERREAEGMTMIPLLAEHLTKLGYQATLVVTKIPERYSNNGRNNGEVRSGLLRQG